MRIYVLVVLWISSLISVGFWQYKEGVKSEKLISKEKQNEELVLANKKIVELQEKAKSIESKNSIALYDISARYEEKLIEGKKLYEKDISDLRNNIIRLRDPGKSFSSADGNGTSEIESSSCKCNGKEGSRLSDEASKFLFGIANEADEIVYQLTACQGVILEDRKNF